MTNSLSEKLQMFSNPEDEQQLSGLDKVLCEADPSACDSEDFDALLKIFEKFPESDGYGVFWSIIHFLEACEGYELILLQSVLRRPVEFNITMINRLINGGVERIETTDLLVLLKQIANSNIADINTREIAESFVRYQNEKSA